MASTERPQILSYGGGLDSWTMLLEGANRGDKPDVVVFCDVTDPQRLDPGEWPGTYKHIEEVVIPFCRQHGVRFEWIDTDRYPIRGERSLFEWMRVRQQVPVNGPTRLCTKIAKVERFEQWLDDNYPDQQVVVWVGFEAGEEERAAKDPNAGKETPRRINRFPLIEWGLCRCGCERVARESGLPVPRKSACVFCAYAGRKDWQTFASEMPEDFARVVKLEADKPLTKNGEKMAIKGFGKKKKNGTRTIQLLDEWVKRPGRATPPKICEFCGQVRATKAAGIGWLNDDSKDNIADTHHQVGEDLPKRRFTVDTDRVNAIQGGSSKEVPMTSASQPYNFDRIVTLNLGLGRDSLTMLCLLVENELVADGQKLGPKDIDAVVFSDTGAEWPHTMAMIEEARDICFEHDIRFLMLRKPQADGPKGWKQFVQDKASGNFKNGAQMPWANENLPTIEERAAVGHYHRRAPMVADHHSRRTVISISTGSCTDNHKISPIRKVINDLAVERFGVSNRQWAHPKSQIERRPHVTLIGIAADESARVKEFANAPRFVTERFPLLEMNISKSDEQAILERHDLGHVRKSGCYACPFQPPSWFWALRETQPQRWNELVAYENQALLRNPKMFITGRKRITEVVDSWRTKNPTATVDQVLDKTYGRGCDAIKAMKQQQKDEARAEAEAQRESKRIDRIARDVERASQPNTCVELFAGCGGMAYGLRLAGFTSLAMVEYDKHAAQTLRNMVKAGALHGEVIEADVRDVDFSRFKGITLLAGGPPCQGFSKAGKLLGEDDPRDGWPSMIRAIRQTEPRYVLAENVANMMSARFQAYRDQIEAQVAELGYTVRWEQVAATELGVPQERQRVFLVAWQHGSDKPSELEKLSGFDQPSLAALLEVEHLNHEPSSDLKDPAPSYYNETWIKKHPATDLDSDDPAHTVIARHMCANVNIVATINTTPGAVVTIHDGDTLPEAWYDTEEYTEDDEALLNEYGITWGRGDLTGTVIEDHGESVVVDVHGYGVEEWYKTAITGNSVLKRSSQSVRAAIQDFPQQWQFAGTETAINRQIGNAVPPTVAEAFGRSINSDAPECIPGSPSQRYDKLLGIVHEPEPKPEWHDEPGCCPFCGEDWELSGYAHWMFDARINQEAGECYLTFHPCCHQASETVERYGYEFFTGRSVEEVASEITGDEVLETIGHSDGTIVCRLHIHNPTQARDELDQHGHHKAASHKGWQVDVFNKVEQHHRHHNAPNGWKFGVAIYNGSVRVGVATVARPNSREIQASQPHTLEVTRVCTWGHSALRKNASSKLYAACAKQARALGYDRLITYTLLDEEDGHSVRCSGWTPTRITDGGSWDCNSRPRSCTAPTGKKVRWEKGLTKKTNKTILASAIELDTQDSAVSL